MQLVANRTGNTVYYSDPDLDGTKSHSNTNSAGRCCFHANPSLAQTNGGKMIPSRTLRIIRCENDDSMKYKCQGTKAGLTANLKFGGTWENFRG